jgi:hypothetical protein
VVLTNLRPLFPKPKARSEEPLGSSLFSNRFLQRLIEI